MVGHHDEPAHMSMKIRRKGRESGVATVEAALVLPFLVLLLFGIVEFASAYAHQNDVRGAALTAARAAARTDGSIGTPGILPLICGSMDVEALGTVTIDISRSPEDPGLTTPAGSRGAIGRAIVSANYQSYTGFFPLFNNVTITQEVDFVVETPIDVTPTWWPLSFPTFTC